MEAANEAVLGVFEREVLHPDVTDTVVRKALDKFRAAQQDKKHDRQRYHQQIAAVNVESSRLVAAIAAGGDIPSLVEAAQQCHSRKTVLLEELAELERNQDIDHDYDELEEELRSHFRHSWQTIITRQVTPARQILGKLFNGTRIPLVPVEGVSGVHFEFKGIASIGRLVTGRAKGLVSPTGPVTPRSIRLALQSICWSRQHKRASLAQVHQ